MGIPRREWQEYLIEAWALGSFMIVLGLASILLEAPLSPLHGVVRDAGLRRGILASAMGVAIVALIYSPWGQRSGAHMNPAVTLAFLRLRKITPRRAVGYAIAQTLGGTLGVCLLWAVFGASFSAPPVSFVTTVPRHGATAAAFFAELAMSALLMLMIIETRSRARTARYAGILVGIFIFVFISLEAPLSGMSLNPARSFASALPAREWASFWIYIIAPIVGMQIPAALFARKRAPSEALCGKIYHSPSQLCAHCGVQLTAD